MFYEACNAFLIYIINPTPWKWVHESETSIRNKILTLHF